MKNWLLQLLQHSAASCVLALLVSPASKRPLHTLWHWDGLVLTGALCLDPSMLFDPNDGAEATVWSGSARYSDQR